MESVDEALNSILYFTAQVLQLQPLIISHSLYAVLLYSSIMF